MDVMQSFSLAGKVAVVTGGAGGYGLQIVSALAEAGAQTFIASRGIARLEEVAEVQRARGHDVTALPLDLEDQTQIDVLHAEVMARTGRCDILVNNAVLRVPAATWGGGMEGYTRSLRINGASLFHITELFARDMIAHGDGSIINIGSMMGMVGVEPLNYRGTDMFATPSPIYFYEKGGMLQFTRWAASLLGPHGVRVNCISPGGLFADQPEPFVRQYSERTQLGRMANDTDLKGAIVFLASEASAYITGANIPVDGGYTAK